LDPGFGVICGEGFWKWRQWDYKLNQDHSATNEFLNKIVQYLSVKEDKRKIRVNTINKDYFEDEAVSFEAELYDDAYELTNSPDVKLRVSNSDGSDFPFTFSKTEKAYQLDAGHFPTGSYRWTAETNQGGQSLKVEGGFSVSQLRLEAMSSTADHSLLNMLSRRHGGEMVFPSKIGDLTEKLGVREDLKPVRYITNEHKPFIHLKWIFFLFLGLLTLEWFSRKFQGSY